jgi:adapter protein MecA 1/2
MRIERINENKLRVFISFDDLEDRDIDLETFNYNTPETQELFWDLMEQAEAELGFDSMESQLCVEAVTDVDHGFIITITRMDDDGEMGSIQKFIKNRSRRKDPVIRKKTAEPASSVAIYCFEDFDAVSGACRRISPLREGSGSSVWSCENNYYLVLSGMENPSGNQRRFEDILSEYGDRVQNTSFFEGYLNEYGICMIPANALERLTGFAPG